MGIYLDNAATSFPKPDCVVSAMEKYMREVGVSSGRGAYRLALKADQMVYETRRSLAKLFNIKDASRLVFTSNVTESLNLAIKGIVSPGDHVVTSAMEHNAVWRCLRVLEAEGVISLSVVPCHRNGTLAVEQLPARLRPTTSLIVMLHASNVMGTLVPVKEVGAIARERDIPFLVDAAQTAGVYPIDVEDLSVDLLAFTGHKGLLGPAGTGGLYIRPGLAPQPLKQGGTGSESSLERQPDQLPERYEAGTLNIPGIVGLGAAVDFLLAQGIGAIRAHERELLAYTYEQLSQIDQVCLYGPRHPDRQIGVFAFNLKGVRPEEAAYVLDEVYGVMVRAGLHCSPCAHRLLGTEQYGTLRVGLGYATTRGDIDALVEGLRAIALRTEGVDTVER